jgi:hypothetical protein
VLNDLNHLNSFESRGNEVLDSETRNFRLVIPASFYMHHVLQVLLDVFAELSKSDCSFVVSVSPHGTTWLLLGKFV